MRLFHRRRTLATGARRAELSATRPKRFVTICRGRCGQQGNAGRDASIRFEFSIWRSCPVRCIALAHGSIVSSNVPQGRGHDSGAPRRQGLVARRHPRFALIKAIFAGLSVVSPQTNWQAFCDKNSRFSSRHYSLVISGGENGFTRIAKTDSSGVERGTCSTQ